MHNRRAIAPGGVPDRSCALASSGPGPNAPFFFRSLLSCAAAWIGEGVVVTPNVSQKCINARQGVVTEEMALR